MKKCPVLAALASSWSSPLCPFPERIPISAPYPVQAPHPRDDPETLDDRDLQLAPDGNRVAMVVSEPAKPSGQCCNIWIYDLRRRFRQFTASAKSDTRPRWSPDGRTLAFLEPRRRDRDLLIAVDGGEAAPSPRARPAYPRSGP